MAVVTFEGFTMRTQWHPIPEIGDWPLDHTAVRASSGTEWGCNGRTPSEQKDATVVCKGKGEELWAAHIAGPDGLAGVQFGMTGLCHQIANRIMLPAKIDVRHSPGNEIATPVFGKYGLGISQLVKRIEDAATAANKEKPKAVSEKQVHDAIQAVTRGLSDEWEIVAEDIDQFIKPKLPGMSPETYNVIKDLYLSLYHKREALYYSLSQGKIAPDRYMSKMRLNLAQTLEDLIDLIGNLKAKPFVSVPIDLAVQYVFFEPPERFRGRPAQPGREHSPEVSAVSALRN